jgi:hypothetical protein
MGFSERVHRSSVCRAAIMPMAWISVVALSPTVTGTVYGLRINDVLEQKRLTLRSSKPRNRQRTSGIARYLC